MNRLTTCQFSSEYFSGFRVEIDLSKIENLKEIVDICKSSLISVLDSHNFEVLSRLAKAADFHIHQPTTLEQARGNPLDVIWICDHTDY